MSAKPRACIVVGVDGAMPKTVLRLVGEGELPNIAALIEAGAWFDDCRPAFPTITPTCWATLATGAPPHVHGVTCQHIHRPGARFDRPVSGYRSEMTHAERFWETFEAAGHTVLVLPYPTAGPSRLKRGFQINGTSCTALEVTPPESAEGLLFEGIEAQLYTTDADEPPRVVWDESSPAARGTGDVWRGVLRGKATRSLCAAQPPAWQVELRRDNSVRLSLEKPNALSCELRPGEWSVPMHVQLDSKRGPIAGWCRVKVLEADFVRRRLRIFATPVADFTGLTRPAEYARALSTMPAVPSMANHVPPFMLGKIDDETFLEIERMNFDWHLEAIRRAWAEATCTLTVAYTVMIDAVNHKYANVLQGYAEADDRKLNRAAETECRAYKLVDDFVGALREMAGADTLFALVADHGAIGHRTVFNPHDALHRAGLLQFRPQTEKGRQREVDFEASRAIPFSTVHIYVNLEGRDPTGCVPQSEYEATVEAIVSALYDYTDPKTGRKPVAVALRKADAGLLGLGGEFTGDVVYGVSGDVGGWIGGTHSCQIPTARTKRGDIRPMLLFAGPGIKKSVRIEAPARLLDIAPTLCTLMDVPPPAQAQGCLLRKAVET